MVTRVFYFFYCTCIFVVKGVNRIGSRYKKVVYKEYTDDTFRTECEMFSSLSLSLSVGPIIKAEVGEQISITFRNKASRPYSISAHGVQASGTHIPVEPGENKTLHVSSFTLSLLTKMDVKSQ
uniref:Plastocyanin-like domain-containing protein n=1 Tax=Labrus bergylta TaxID=56723 RepID=A0A3Q3F9H2_9LABR